MAKFYDKSVSEFKRWLEEKKFDVFIYDDSFMDIDNRIGRLHDLVFYAPKIVCMISPNKVCLTDQKSSLTFDLVKGVRVGDGGPFEEDGCYPIYIRCVSVDDPEEEIEWLVFAEYTN